MHEPFITQQAQLQTKPWINCSVKHYHIEGKKTADAANNHMKEMIFYLA